MIGCTYAKSGWKRGLATPNINQDQPINGKFCSHSAITSSIVELEKRALMILFVFFY